MQQLLLLFVSSIVDVSFSSRNQKEYNYEEHYSEGDGEDEYSLANKQILIYPSDGLEKASSHHLDDDPRKRNFMNSGKISLGMRSTTSSNSGSQNNNNHRFSSYSSRPTSRRSRTVQDTLPAVPTTSTDIEEGISGEEDDYGFNAAGGVPEPDYAESELSASIIDGFDRHRDHDNIIDDTVSDMDMDTLAIAIPSR